MMLAALSLIGHPRWVNRLTQHQVTGMNLTLIRITMRIGMPCAIVTVSAVGLFIVVRHFAWMG